MVLPLQERTSRLVPWLLPKLWHEWNILKWFWKNVSYRIRTDIFHLPQGDSNSKPRMFIVLWIILPNLDFWMRSPRCQIIVMVIVYGLANDFLNESSKMYVIHFWMSEYILKWIKLGWKAVLTQCLCNMVKMWNIFFLYVYS